MKTITVKDIILSALVVVIVVFALLTLLRNEEKGYEAIIEPGQVPIEEGRALVQSGEKEKILLDLMNKDPENAKITSELGDFYFEGRRFGEAIAYYERTISLDPLDIDSYNDLGLSLHYTGNTERGIEILRKGVDTDPGVQRAWLSLGFLLTSAGQADEARSALTKVIEMDPDNDVAEEAQRILGFIK